MRFAPGTQNGIEFGLIRPQLVFSSSVQGLQRATKHQRLQTGTTLTTWVKASPERPVWPKKRRRFLFHRDYPESTTQKHISNCITKYSEYPRNCGSGSGPESERWEASWSGPRCPLWWRPPVTSYFLKGHKEIQFWFTSSDNNKTPWFPVYKAHR